MTLFPFILIRKKELNDNRIFLNHEHIHLRQQIELFVIPFYIFYGLNYIFNRLKYKQHDKAYRNICFEREASQNEKNLNYLKGRIFFNWINYLRR